MPVGFPLGAMYQTKYVFKENSPGKKTNTKSVLRIHFYVEA